MSTRLRLKLIRLGIISVIIFSILHFFGLTAHLLEENFEKNFNYPFEGDIFEQCLLIRQNLRPKVFPINNQTFSIRHINREKCSGQIFLTIVVKSAINHFVRREAIRNSWGTDAEIDGYQIRTIFTLGVDESTHNNRESSIQKLVDLEADEYNDIVQVRFSYKNICENFPLFLHRLDLKIKR